MDREHILHELAPCGLDCSRCVSCASGTVKKLSDELTAALAGFEKKAQLFAKMAPALEGYTSCMQVLHHFSSASCSGCRSGGGKFPLCAVKDCYKEKGVDFCGGCDEFPCGRNSFPDQFKAMWIENNTMIKELGIEAFYSQQKTKPRY